MAENTRTHAQILYTSGQFAEAQHTWEGSLQEETTLREYGMRLRGLAATEDRLGVASLALDAAERAYRYHEHDVGVTMLRGSSAEQNDALRERAQSAAVLGQITVRSAVNGERSGKMTRAQADAVGERGVANLRDARYDLGRVSTDDRPDQYLVNLASRSALGEALYGSQKKARVYGREAFRLGFLSEGKQVANAANISLKYTALAKARAITRGVGAFMASHVAPLPIPGKRRGMLAIAANRLFGL